METSMRNVTAYRLWKIVNQFTADHRAMLTVDCPDCQFHYSIRRTQYRKFRSCNRCRFVVQNRSNLGKHSGAGDLTKTYFNYFRNVARRRAIPFEVSIEYLWDLAVQQGMKCALSGLEIVFPTVSGNMGSGVDSVGWQVDYNTQ